MVQQVDDPGGVRGKMNSSRTPAFAAAGAGLEGRESALFGTVSWWSLGLPFGADRPVSPELDWMVG